MAKSLQQGTVTIANGGTVSTAHPVRSNQTVVALITPAAITGASFSFQASFDAETFTPVYTEGSQYTVNVEASRFVSLDPNVLSGAKYIKVVSGTTETAARNITIITGEL